MRQAFFYYGIFSTLYALSIYIQTTLIFNPDISWLMLAAKRLLAGGTYAKDFFELNPPMAIYIYIPAIVIAQFTKLSAQWSLCLYVYIIASYSLYLCAKITKEIFAAQNSFNFVFLISIAAIFLVLPGGALGQRENFLIILTIPYFLLLASKLDNKTLSPKIQIIIGLMAGIGFAIKPFFLLSFVLVEIYFKTKNKNINLMKRPELSTSLFVILFYAVLILLLHNDYFYLVIPHAAPTYFDKLSIPLSQILKNDQIIYSIFVFLLCIIGYKNNPFKHLSTILLLAGVGFLFSFVIQRANWFYRSLPIQSIDLLLSVLLFQILLAEKLRPTRENILLGIISICFLFWLLAKATYIWLTLFFYPPVYFIFFAILFYIISFNVHTHNIFKAVISTFAILTMGYLTYQLAHHTDFLSHQFSITTLALYLLFLLFLPQKGINIKSHFAFMALIGFALFSQPFFKSTYTYHVNYGQVNQLKKYFALMKQYSNQSISFLTSASYAFPTADLYHLELASRFQNVNFQPHLYFHDNDFIYQKAYVSHRKEMDFFTNAIAEDINRYQPKFIFVDVRSNKLRDYKVRLKNSVIESEQTDYVRLFSLNPVFRNVWKRYDYLKTVEDQSNYKFRIYKLHHAL